MNVPNRLYRRLLNKVLKPDSHTADVISGASVALALRLVGAGLAFMLNVVIGRLLGAEGAGVYFLTLSVVTIVAVMTRLGLDNALLRFIASGAGTGDWGKVFGVFRLGMRVALCSSVSAAVLVLLAAPWIAERLFGEVELTQPLRIMSLGIVSLSMMTLLAESLKGLKRISNSMLVSSVIYPGVALLVIWPLELQFGAPGAAMAYVMGTALAAIIGWAMWRANTASLVTATPSFERGLLWRSCRPLWVMSIINRGILPWAPLFLLGVWGTVEEAGVLGAATRVAALAAILPASFNAIIAPKFAELYVQGEIEMLRRIAWLFALLVTLVASPLLLLLIFAGDWVLGFFGPGFIKGGAALAILAVGQAINTITGPMGYLLMMTGHERDCRNASIASMAFLLVSSLLLVPQLGLIGAAIASAASQALRNAYHLLLVQRRLNVVLPGSRADA